MPTRDASVRRILWITFALNVAVASLKAGWGWYTGTVSMVADGFHSLFDGVSNIIGLAGLSIASRPPDHDHPYGHKKYETLATLGIVGLMVLTALEVLREAGTRLLDGGGPRVTGESFAIMIVTMGVNFGVSRYEANRGRELGSDFLVADSMHTLSDLYTSATVLVGLVGIRMGFPLVDPLVALVVVVVIARMALRIMRGASAVLLDASPLDPEQVRRMVLGVPGVRGCHGIRTRGRPDHVHVDLHLFLDADTSIDVAHRRSHEVMALLKREIPGVEDVVIHVEPHRSGLGENAVSG